MTHMHACAHASMRAPTHLRQGLALQAEATAGGDVGSTAEQRGAGQVEGGGHRPACVCVCLAARVGECWNGNNHDSVCMCVGLCVRVRHDSSQQHTPSLPAALPYYITHTHKHTHTHTTVFAQRFPCAL